MAVPLNRRIMDLIRERAISFDPMPRWEQVDERGEGIADTASVPMRLGPIIYVLPEGVEYEWDPSVKRSPEWWQTHGKRIDLRTLPDKKFKLAPNRIALCETLEHVTLRYRQDKVWDARKRRFKPPKNYNARLEGRTQHGARMALLVHATAPNIWIDTRHRPTAECIPVAQIAVWLVYGYSYFQLSLERAEGKLYRGHSRTNGQRSPIGDHHSHRRGHRDLHRDAVFVDDAVAAANRQDPGKVVRFRDATRQGQSGQQVPYRQRRSRQNR